MRQGLWRALSVLSQYTEESFRPCVCRVRSDGSALEIAAIDAPGHYISTSTNSHMSIKLLISFGELGYGFARKVSKIEVPASWTNSRPIADIIMLVCEDYNKTKAGGSAIAADSTSHAVLDANEVYLASSDGSRIDPTELCSRLSTGDYFIKMVYKCLKHS